MIGLDCGTSFYIMASPDVIKKQRNAFLTVDGDPVEAKRMLRRQSIPYVEKSGKVHIVGQHAFNYAQIFHGAQLRRPMRMGLLNPDERDALPIIAAIVQELIGTAKVSGEICVYCVPARPIDQDRRIDYHEDVLRAIIEQHGYTPKVISEAVALSYEGLVDDNLTGIAISMGAGMTNVAVCYQGMTAISFSVARGGDWIDQNVSADCGCPVAKVQNIKESSTSLDLSSNKVHDIYDEGTEEANILHAIRSYYGALINYILTNLKVQFEDTANVPQFPEDVPIVIGGGTGLVKGFLDVFNEQFDQETFPIPISEIRLVSDSHTAIARGCLSESELIEEENSNE